MKNLFLILICCFSISTTFAQKFKVGEAHPKHGGIIIALSIDGEHGIIAAEQDLEEAMQWDDAVKACTEIGEKRYWYMPSKGELALMFGLHQKGMGNFQNTVYWSFTEHDKEDSWARDFEKGREVTGYKANEFRVRPVRTF